MGGSEAADAAQASRHSIMRALEREVRHGCPHRRCVLNTLVPVSPSLCYSLSSVVTLPGEPLRVSLIRLKPGMTLDLFCAGQHPGVRAAPEPPHVYVSPLSSFVSAPHIM